LCAAITGVFPFLLTDTALLLLDGAKTDVFLGIIDLKPSKKQVNIIQNKNKTLVSDTFASGGERTVGFELLK
jgi:hypothetical protein